MEEHQDMKFGRKCIFCAYQNVKVSTKATPTPLLFTSATFHALNNYQSPIIFISSRLFCLQIVAAVAGR